MDAGRGRLDLPSSLPARRWVFAPDREFQVCLPGGQRSLASMSDLIPGAGPGWETALLLPVPAHGPGVVR